MYKWAKFYIEISFVFIVWLTLLFQILLTWIIFRNTKNSLELWGQFENDWSQRFHKSYVVWLQNYRWQHFAYFTTLLQSLLIVGQSFKDITLWIWGMACTNYRSAETVTTACHETETITVQILLSSTWYGILSGILISLLSSYEGQSYQTNFYFWERVQLSVPLFLSLFQLLLDGHTLWKEVCCCHGIAKELFQGFWFL